jgi:hypothetical protein
MRRGGKFANDCCEVSGSRNRAKVTRPLEDDAARLSD